MIILLSPAKTIRTPRIQTEMGSDPAFADIASKIAGEIRKLSFADFCGLLKVSGNLARQSYDVMQRWHWPHDPQNSFPAALMYDGPAFKGLNASDFSEDDKKFAQSHLRILSGLYGVLRPYDRIMFYRLEAQTPLSVKKNKNLYHFWNSIPSRNIEADLKRMKSNLLVNLTSDEYGKMVVPHVSSSVKVVNVAFKQMKAGRPFINVVEMKKARGMMARFIIQGRIKDSGDLVAFDMNGYYFERALSDENNLTFLRA